MSGNNKQIKQKSILPSKCDCFADNSRNDHLILSLRDIVSEYLCIIRYHTGKSGVRSYMKKFSEKVYLNLEMPTEEFAVNDEKRIRLALEAIGYAHVQMPLAVMRRLYPLCRNAGFDITVTLVRRDADWVMTDIEPGDTSMFFDIGTNGELVIGNKDWMIAGAGAAGPALEGYLSRY